MKAPTPLALLAVLGHAGAALAYDSGPQALGPQPGATDYYRISCAAAGSVDHLDFRLADTTSLSAETPVLNVRVSKGGLLAEETAITPGESKELILQGGNGKYRVTVDSTGTALAGKQTYTLGFQCLNAEGQATKLSSKGITAKIPGNKAKNHAVKCSSKKQTGATDRLAVTLSNTTRSSQVLMAQLVQGQSAINTTAGTDISLKGAANANYYLTVDHTGTNPGQNNSKQYSFEARCMNSAHEDLGDPVVDLLQDE